MTGFGSSSFDKSGVKISVEVRTLNSKFLDVLIKLPKEFNDQELTVKSIVTDKLQRGKVNVNVDLVDESAGAANQIDTGAFRTYYNQLKALAEELEEGRTDCFELTTHLPEIISPSENEPSKELWQLIETKVIEALDHCDDFRIEEGRKLQVVLARNIEVIADKLKLVDKADPERIKSIKEKIKGNLREHLTPEMIDQNRFEQEVVYFLEKLDITEEKVRLKSHLKYFIEILEASNSQGKKLGFITQEIGREINTIGSKANNATIQHLVVEMKEELEKIREQLLNIL